MKKIQLNIKIFLLFLLCCAETALSTETLVTQLFISNQQKEYRHVFLYAASGGVQLETKYILSGSGDWVRLAQTEWFYSGKNCVKQIERVFEGGAWKNTDEIESVYNRVNNKTDEIVYRYVADGTKSPVKMTKFMYESGLVSRREEYAYPDGVEQLSIANTFIYNNDKVSRQETELYRSGRLDSVYRSTFVYEPFGAIKSQATVKLVDDTYRNTDSITWFYDGAGLLVSQRMKKWNGKIGAWDNSQIINYEYDANSNLISEIYMTRGDMAWENVCRYEYSYEDGVQSKRTLQTQLYREWRDLVSIHYRDFADGNARTISSEYDFWGGNPGEPVHSYIPFMFNGEWVIRDAESIRVSYDNPSSVTNNSEGTYPIVRIYPNPSDGVFYLNTEKHEILSWNVYDLKGQLVKSHVQMHHTGVIDLTELMRGIYILRLETTAGTQQQKLIKQ